MGFPAEIGFVRDKRTGRVYAIKSIRKKGARRSKIWPPRTASTESCKPCGQVEEPQKLKEEIDIMRLLDRGVKKGRGPQSTVRD